MCHAKQTVTLLVHYSQTFSTYLTIAPTEPNSKNHNFAISILLSSHTCSIQVLPLYCILIVSKHLVRKDMDVNDHERISNITLRHKFK
jgi:hypothetical protein